MQEVVPKLNFFFNFSLQSSGLHSKISLFNAHQPFKRLEFSMLFNQFFFSLGILLLVVFGVFRFFRHFKQFSLTKTFFEISVKITQATPNYYLRVKLCFVIEQLWSSRRNITCFLTLGCTQPFDLPLLPPLRPLVTGNGGGGRR